MTDKDGNILENQIVPLPKPVMTIPGRKSFATHEVLFWATNLPGLTSRSYHVVKKSGIVGNSDSEVRQYRGQPTPMTLGFIGQNNMVLNQFGSIKRIGTMKIGQMFGWYEGFAGKGSSDQQRSSGAYIFRPKYQTPNLFRKPTLVVTVKGNLVQEIHQQFTPWISQVVRIYKGVNETEFEWLVGPIPIEDRKGKEIISIFNAPEVQSSGKYYTDSNARQMIERLRNYRPTWKLNATEPTSGNYYPINSRIFIKDTNNLDQVTVLNDRSQGGGSLNDGQVELMIHRRLLHDDQKGVNEALNETAFGKGLVVRGKHFLQLSPKGQGAARKHRLKAEEIFMDVQLSFRQTQMNARQFMKQSNEFKLFHIKENLPKSIHLLTLEKWNGDDELLLRLEHQFDDNEDPLLSMPVTLDIKGLITNVKVIDIQETTLGANLNIENYHKMQWKTVSSDKMDDDITQNGGSIITLRPMDIRTFIVKIQ